MVTRVSQIVTRSKRVRSLTLLLLFISGLAFGKAVTTNKVETLIVSNYEKQNVLVSESKIVAGTKVSEVQFKTISFPKDSIPKNVVTNIEGYKAFTFLETIPAGVPFTLDSLYESNSLNPVLESIPEGMRAITLKVDAITSVEGWAQSGSYVDILLTEKNQAVVIAEKIKIISVERKTDVQHSENPSIPSTITLLVNQDQCLAINLALSKGKLSFALRNINDENNWINNTLESAHLGRSSVTKNTSGKLKINGKIEWELVDSKWIKIK